MRSLKEASVVGWVQTASAMLFVVLTRFPKMFVMLTLVYAKIQIKTKRDGKYLTRTILQKT